MAIYKIDPAHSSANFVARHMMISNVRGTFSGVEGSVIYDPKDLAASKVEATIDVYSISTNDANRDVHLKSPEFLDAGQFPAITFNSTSFQRHGDEFEIKGNLTIHGVTKEVTLKVEPPSAETKDPWGNTRIGASATTKIKRSDFGLTWNAALEAGGVLIGDELKIEIEVSLIKG